MPPIVRYEPSEIVGFTAQYAVVGHYGESSGVALWINAGERLPLITAIDIEPPVWYVRIDGQLEVTAAVAKAA
jgi:hypothetical protein